jgi:hypothetical protein
VAAVAWQTLTRDWWENDRPNFNLFTSDLVIGEASGGDTEAAKKRLEILSMIPVLRPNEAAEMLTNRLLAERTFPDSSANDAAHVALATVHRMDFLLTWNCRHLDNPVAKPRIRQVCIEMGYECPEICTPLELQGGYSSDV